VLDKTPLMPIGEGFANLLPEPGAETYGVAYEITAEDLAHVDLTEGVLIGNYERVEIAIESLVGDGPTRAFTLTSGKRSPELIPSDRYLAILIEGAELHGLPMEWIAMLRAVPTCVQSAEAIASRRIVDAALAAARRKE
jgi:hypothetical protein